MTTEADRIARTEVRDGMSITWNAPIQMSDGVVLRADVFRPVDENLRCPVILTLGPYAKGLSYQEGFALPWQKMVADYPEILEGSTNKYQVWEVTDPERWVPHAYAVVRVDSRGSGWSEGLLDPLSPQETDDICEAIEWAGQQSWSTGAVGVLGVSYFAVMGWRAAARHPKHLKALVAWEGFVDLYRDSSRHGGILTTFGKLWASMQAVTVQYGLGGRARKNPNTGQSIAGPITDPSQVHLPFLSTANWGGMGIHERGNFLGFTGSPAKQKWLEVHGDTHWSLFSANYGLDLQKRFLDRFLKGIDNGWDSQPPVLLNIRHIDGHFGPRAENEWPLARTQWTRYYFDAATGSLNSSAPSSPSFARYDTTDRGLQFKTSPILQETEITGPMAAKLFISCSTSDTDLFLTVQIFDPAGREQTFQGAQDPNTPIGMGWLRTSHRRVDPSRSEPWQPFHPHDAAEPLTPGELVEVDVEILPTCLVLPRGWSIGLSVRGKDYEYEGELSDFARDFHYATRGTGGVLHNEELDRPPGTFDGTVALYTGGSTASYLLLPIVPA